MSKETLIARFRQFYDQFLAQNPREFFNDLSLQFGDFDGLNLGKP
jgi:hypothetical protein